MKRLLGVVLFGVLVVLASCSNPFESRDIVLVGLGDSLTKGVGDEEDREGYFGRVADGLVENGTFDSVETINEAVSGRKSAELLDALKEEEDVQRAVERADVIALSIGGNDVMGVFKKHALSLSVEPFQEEYVSYEERLRAIVEAIESLNKQATIVFLSLYDPVLLVAEDTKEVGAILEEWNGGMRSIVEERPSHRRFIDISDPVRAADESLYAEDYFHPNAKGYTLIAEQWLNDWKNE